MALTRYCMVVLDSRPDIGVFARPAGLAVAAVGDEIELALLARGAVDVGTAPGIVRNGALQVRPAPVGLVCRSGDQRGQTLLGSGVAPRVEPVLVEGFFQGVELRPGHLDRGLADLR